MNDVKWYHTLPIFFRAPCFTFCITFKAPSTLIRFQTKTELFCSGYGYRPHYNAENDHRKRSHSKTLSRVERFENDAFWKRCFLVWTVKTMLSENGDVIKTTRPWVSKMADRRYHVASTSRQFRRSIYWNAHASSSFDHAHWGYNSVFKQIKGSMRVTGEVGRFLWAAAFPVLKFNSG